jgi:hypothetical protein
MKTFLHCLIPKEIFHVLQEGLKFEVTAVGFEFVLVYAREVKDIAD